MSSESITMLSIDDKTLTTDLDRAGYRKMGVFVKAAANYDEALAYLQKRKIDIIVINMDYSQVNANNICSHLKAQEEYAEIPIVQTSVQTSARVRKSALDAGADLFVEQPLPRQYFIEKLKTLLEQKTRATQRVDVHGEVTCTVDNREFSCPIGDLSISGILLATDDSLPDGSTVDMSFVLPGGKKPVKAQGEVVRTIPPSEEDPTRLPGVGVRFTKFHADSESRLEKYIAKSSDASSGMQYYL